MKEKKLTERQKRFVDFYIKTGNANESARLAGYFKNVVVVTIGTGKGYSKSEIVKVPISTRERLKAAEYLAKIHGAFKNEVQITSAVPIVISGGDELED